MFEGELLEMLRSTLIWKILSEKCSGRKNTAEVVRTVLDACVNPFTPVKAKNGLTI